MTGGGNVLHHVKGGRIVQEGEISRGIVQGICPGGICPGGNFRAEQQYPSAGSSLESGLKYRSSIAQKSKIPADLFLTHIQAHKIALG